MDVLSGIRTPSSHQKRIYIRLQAGVLGLPLIVVQYRLALSGGLLAKFFSRGCIQCCMKVGRHDRCLILALRLSADQGGRCGVVDQISDSANAVPETMAAMRTSSSRVREDLEGSFAFVWPIWIHEGIVDVETVQLIREEEKMGSNVSLCKVEGRGGYQRWAWSLRERR